MPAPVGQPRFFYVGVAQPRPAHACHRPRASADDPAVQIATANSLRTYEEACVEKALEESLLSQAVDASLQRRSQRSGKGEAEGEKALVRS